MVSELHKRIGRRASEVLNAEAQMSEAWLRPVCRLSVIPGSPDQIQVVVRHDLISGGMFVAGGGCGTCTLTEDFSAFGGDFCASNPVTIPFSDAFGFGDCWSGGSDATITLAI